MIFMKRISNFLLPLSLAFVACTGHRDVQPATEKADGFEIKIIQNDTLKTGVALTGYGYDILRNGKVYIHQPMIPALPGNQGFSTAAQAQKAAEFVLYKINQQIMPPSVTAEELDSLGLLK
ncbi:MAG: hypothetical protein JWQ27_2970 [Ferruginibacter sp.]|nr:hypothetical protein [Ferruginibacter sp.]